MRIVIDLPDALVELFRAVVRAADEIRIHAKASTIDEVRISVEPSPERAGLEPATHYRNGSHVRN